MFRQCVCAICQGSGAPASKYIRAKHRELYGLFTGDEDFSTPRFSESETSDNDTDGSDARDDGQQVEPPSPMPLAPLALPASEKICTNPEQRQDSQNNV
jgi:hypothetical protein